jgi:hypothetical protein
MALVTGILFGLWPTLQLSRTEVSQVIQSNARRLVSGKHARAQNPECSWSHEGLIGIDKIYLSLPMSVFSLLAES